MKPSILIVIFDFLVSSLLLFVVAEGDPRSPLKQQKTGEQIQVSDDFSPAAIEEMRSQWEKEYSEQMQYIQLAATLKEIENLKTRVEQNDKTIAELHSDKEKLFEEKLQAQKQAELARGEKKLIEV